MNSTDKKQALSWYVEDGFSLSAIAHHYSVSIEVLKTTLHNV